MKLAWASLMLILMSSIASYAVALDKTNTGFIYPIGEEEYTSGSGTWLKYDYMPGYYHIGEDMMTYVNNASNEDSHVYAISRGKIYKKHCDDDSWGPGNCALFVEHKTNTGESFTAVYGHLVTNFSEGDFVESGEYLGYTGFWNYGIHLHFGVYPGVNVPPTSDLLKKGWGRMGTNNWPDGPDSGTPDTNTFTDPVGYIKGNAPGAWNVDCQDLVDKYPNEMAGVSCDSAYYYPSGRYLVQEDNGVDTCLLTIFDVVMNNGIPSISNIATEYAMTSSVELNPLVTLNIGPGFESLPELTEPAELGKPDFIVPSVKLMTASGEEKYTWFKSEEMYMHVWVDNIGDADWEGDHDYVEVRYYLSQGLKEDLHSEWERVGIDYIQKYNLDVSDDPKHEDDRLILVKR